jgi:hypothetical protein
MEKIGVKIKVGPQRTRYVPKWWEITVLLFGLIGLIWFLSCRYLAPSLEKAIAKGVIPEPVLLGKETQFRRAEGYEDLLSKVQNGDLLFFAGSSQGERVIRFFHNSYYSHMCIVFKDPNGAIDDTPENTIFIWETDLGQRYKDGPRIMRLSEKLDRWKGSKIGMWMRYIPPDALGLDRPLTSDILAIAQEYLDADIQMDINMVSWFFCRWPESFIFRSLKNKNNVFCSELVADTLQRIGILAKGRHPSWYTPENFARGQVPIIKGNYASPVYFKF